MNSLSGQLKRRGRNITNGGSLNAKEHHVNVYLEFDIEAGNVSCKRLEKKILEAEIIMKIRFTSSTYSKLQALSSQ